MIARAMAHKTKTRQDMREFLRQYLREHPCVDCGEDDIIVLDFEHQGDKMFNISEAPSLGVGWKTLKAEIAKCEVRCANCHRRKTHRERMG